MLIAELWVSIRSDCMKVKNCECCFMPLNKDPKESGSDKYCSYCFANGKLIAETMTLKELKKATA